MKKNLFYLFLTLTLSALLASCNKPDEQEPSATTTKITLLSDTVRIGCEGGVATIDYTISASIDDASVQVSPSQETAWLNDFDTSIEGSISFNVSENTEQTPREAEVSVTYADAKASFTVLQAAAEAEDPQAFTITVSDVAQDSAKISIIPSDLEATYMFGVTTSNTIKAYPSDELFISEFLIPYYTETAAAYGLSLTDYLSQALMIGEASGSVSGLSAETEYIAFCFGLTTEAEVTTELVQESFTTLSLGEFNATIDVSVVEGDATVTVTPEDDAQGYLIAVFEGIGHNEQDINASLQSTTESMISDAIMPMWGMIDRSEAVAMLTKHGQQSQTYNLESETDYTATAFAINTDGTVTSKAVIKEFRTESVSPSDIQISVEYTSVAGRVIEYTVTPSNGDGYVFFTYPHNDTFKNMSDDEIIDYIVANENILNYTRYGAVATYERDLVPESEYVTYAFGVSGGEPTTGLFEFFVTTGEAVKNSSTFSYKSLAYFNGDEAAELYPDILSSAAGKCMLPATYQVEGEWYGIWHGIFQGDLSGYSEEELYAGTKYSGRTWIDANVVNLLDYNQTYTAVGFVETQDGNYGEIYMVTFTTSEDGCSPISEFDSSIFDDAYASSSSKTAGAPLLRLPEKDNTVKAAPASQSKVTTGNEVSETYKVGEEATPDKTVENVFILK